ncbi:MAG: hypothetical protein OXI61_00115 [Candidatus Poribacteria bacterium]|nr:hypothetical protein [Candidatus Poribacteria bacterium]
MESNGVAFYISSYRRVGAFAKITGGYFEANLSASGVTYYWVRKRSKWKLVHIGSMSIA